MFKNPILLTIITCGVFFFLATATSQEGDFDTFAELNLTVDVVDTSLAITNNDTLNITNGFMTLEKPTSDSLNGQPVTVSYTVNGFNLNMSATDTFPMSVFTTPGTDLIYPVDTFPHSFNLNFQSTVGGGFFDVIF